MLIHDESIETIEQGYGGQQQVADPLD